MYNAALGCTFHHAAAQTHTDACMHSYSMKNDDKIHTIYIILGKPYNVRVCCAIQCIHFTYYLNDYEQIISHFNQTKTSILLDIYLYCDSGTMHRSLWQTEWSNQPTYRWLGNMAFICVNLSITLLFKLLLLLRFSEYTFRSSGSLLFNNKKTTTFWKRIKVRAQWMQDKATI